jgi:hypothetical protein
VAKLLAEETIPPSDEKLKHLFGVCVATWRRIASDDPRRYKVLTVMTQKDKQERKSDSHCEANIIYRGVTSFILSLKPRGFESSNPLVLEMRPTMPYTTEGR